MEQVAAGANPPVAQLGSVNGARDALTDDLLAGRFFSIDVRGNVTGWNPRAEAAFGWSTHHVSGQSLFETLVVPGLGFGAEELEEFFAAAGGGAGRRVRVLLAHQAGGQLPVELSIVPIQLAKAYELNAFLQDVSTSTGSGVASEIGRVREEHADVLAMITGSLEQEPGKASEEVRLAGALIVFHIDAGAMTNVPVGASSGSGAAAAEDGTAAAPPVGTTAGELETARAEAERVRAQIDEAMAAAEQARTEAEEARRERDELQARIDAEAGEAGDAEQIALQAAEQARAEAERVRGEAEAARAELEELRASAEEARARAEQAEASVDSSKSEVEEARREGERLRGELEGLRAAADGTQASAEQTAAELGQARAELSQAQADYERVGEELASAQAELAQAREERDALRGDLEDLKVKFDARGQAEQALVEAREKLEVAEKAVAATEAELESVGSEREAAAAEAQAASEELEAARAELEQVRSEAETAKSDAAAQAESLTAELESAQAELESTQAELKAAREELDAVRAELDGVKAQAEAAGQTAGSAQEELGNARAEAIQARADAEAATKRAEQAEADAAAAREEAAAAADVEVPAPDDTFERVFDGAAIGMAIKADGRFERVNRAFCELVGHDADALLAVDPVELVHPDERKAHAATEKSIVSGKATGSQAEARLVHADGSEVPVRETASLVADGRILFQFEIAPADAHTAVEEPPAPAPVLDEEPEVVATDEIPGDNLPAPVETSTALAPADGIASRIRQALAEDAFQIYAQPIINLMTSEVTQHELLLRMNDDSGRLMLPDKFLPAARDAGLMQAIDQWVVRQAIGLIHTAAGDDRRLMLEVNVSAESIDDPALTAVIESELDATGIDPRLLVIEVTEDAALQKIDDTIKLSKWLRSMGCRFALDDFGSTFATVKYLKDMSVDYFKLDGDLIVTLPESRTNQLLLNALMDVARGTGTQTIAVYVPDDETLVMLRQYGIGYGQGNRVGRPRPVGEI